jgi:hypothetical protein
MGLPVRPETELNLMKTFSRRLRWVLAAAAVAVWAPGMLGAQAITIPAGTILAASLDKTISSKDARAGLKISATLMQDAPLDGTNKLSRGTKIEGTVVSVRSAADGREEVTLRFDELRRGHWSQPVTLSLRALAGMTEVENAKLPSPGNSFGESESAWTTTQIGGDTVLRGGGKVVADREVIGTPTPYGVLVPALPNKDRGCSGGAAAGNAKPQAFWLFSASACGIYGLPDVQIVKAGGGITDEAGTIVLSIQRGKLALGSGSGILLRVVGQARAK